MRKLSASSRQLSSQAALCVPLLAWPSPSLAKVRHNMFFSYQWLRSCSHLSYETS